MQANTRTPFEIFGNQVRYVVPMFQRPYVWNELDQWAPLWDDVRTVADRLVEWQNAVTFGQDAANAHFLGAIVLDQQMGPAGFITSRHVIDGQQRLTTLQLLLDAAQLVMQSHGDPVDASAVGNLVLNNAAIIQSPDDVFKVWPTNPDRDAFRAAMDDKASVPADLTKSQVVKAHKYFTDAVTEWAEVTGDPDKVRARLHALAMTLSQYLKVVVIDLEPGDNAQVIFETLNHRGTPLLAADLVKNLVFQLAEAQNLDLDALYDARWKTFDQTTWRRVVKQGRLTRPRVDVFLNYWLTMATVREVPTDRIFTDFRTFVLAQAGQDVTSVLDHLHEGAAVYDNLETLNPWSYEGTFYYRVIRVMEQAALSPLLLWLFSQPSNVVTPEDRELALRALESWSVRRMLCRATAKQVNLLVVDMLEHLQKLAKGDPPGRAVAKFLADQTAETRSWPTNDEVRASLSRLQIYRSLTRARVRMLLEALEDSLRTPKTEDAHCPRGTLTIEHVMPQGWREHWALAVDDGGAAFERDILVQTIGNLTLATSSLNPALSNRPWTDDQAKNRGLPPKGKRTILSDHSVLLLNKRIVDDHPDGWNEGLIEDRTGALIDRILELWPPPATLLGP